MPKVIIPLAPGFEEIEAITLIDILRRANITVTTAALEDRNVVGSHNVSILADKDIQDINVEDFDMMVLPGGMPGSINLKKHPKVISLLQEFHNRGKDTAAVCAAPIVLAQAGLLEGKNVTSFPGFESQLGKVHYKETPVVEDDSVITSRGPGTAAYLAFTIVKRLVGPAKAEELQKTMLYRQM